MTAQPFVSVVTPFYNTAELLGRCIESVLSQDHGNFEYILLDNRSTDGGGAIAERYAAMDVRIRFVRAEEHVPMIPNFNRALRLLSPASEFCKVAMADDWLAPACLRRMVEVAAAHSSVGLVCCYHVSGGRLSGTGLPYWDARFDGRDVSRRILLGRMGVFGTQTAHLYRSSIVRERAAFYDEQSLQLDIDVCFEILRDWDLGFVHDVLTFESSDLESFSGKWAGFNPVILHELLVAERFGPAFLERGELEPLIATLWREYRQFLGEAWLDGREPRFWEFHRKGLATIGRPLSEQELARWAARIRRKRYLKRLAGLLT